MFRLGPQNMAHLEFLFEKRRPKEDRRRQETVNLGAFQHKGTCRVERTPKESAVKRLGTDGFRTHVEMTASEKKRKAPGSAKW